MSRNVDNYDYFADGRVVRKSQPQQPKENSYAKQIGLQPQFVPRDTSFRGDDRLIIGQTSGGSLMVQPVHVLPRPSSPRNAQVYAAPAYMGYSPYGQAPMIVATEPRLVVTGHVQRAHTAHGPVMVTGIAPYGAYAGLYRPF